MPITKRKVSQAIQDQSAARATAKSAKSSANAAKHAVNKKTVHAEMDAAAQSKLDPAPVITGHFHTTPEDRLAIVEWVCDQTVETTLSLVKILAKLGKPNPPSARVFYRWLDEEPKLQAIYRQAKTHQADTLAEETLEIADDSSLDVIVNPETGVEQVNSERIKRSKLRVDTRMKLAGCLKMGRYGTKQEIDVKSTTFEAFLLSMTEPANE